PGTRGWSRSARRCAARPCRPQAHRRRRRPPPPLRPRHRRVSRAHMAVRHHQGWRSMMQRGLDSASEFADVAARKLNCFADPRARLLRKRRLAVWLGLFFGVTTLFWALVTLVMATWTVPAWALLIPGAIAVGAAAPTVWFLLRWRWLRSEPLPSPRPGAM